MIRVDDTKVLAYFLRLPASLRAALRTKVTALRLMLESRAKAKVSGQVLNVRTGNLRRSIFSETIANENEVIGRAASSGDVKYAAIHEYGGITPAHDIFPSKAKALAFMVGGKQVFAKVVHHPGSVMPERSFMRSSLHEMEPQIIEGLRSAASEALHA